MTSYPDVHPLMLDKQMPKWSEEPTHCHAQGDLLLEIKEHYLHWVALYLENAAGVVPNAADIESLNDPSVDRLDSFIQQITMRFSASALVEETIHTIHRTITADDENVMRFIHCATQFLVCHWRIGALRELVVALISSTSHWATPTRPDELEFATRCPGWVPEADAEHYVHSVYWMVAVVLLSQLSYSDIRRRLKQLHLISPYEFPPKTQRPKSGRSA